MMIILIVAVDRNWRIGVNGSLPFDCPQDKKYFRDATLSVKSGKKNAIIMGRKTFEDCGILKNRLNVVISRSLKTNDNLTVFSSLRIAIKTLMDDATVDKIFICGGAEIYREAIENGYCDVAYVSRIGDTFLRDYLNIQKLGEEVFFPKKEFLEHFLETSVFNATLDFQVIEFKKLD